MKGLVALTACCLALLVGCTSSPTKESPNAGGPPSPLPESVLPHNLRLSQYLHYNDGTEDGTNGVAPCVQLASIGGSPIHRIGVIASTTGGNSIYTQDGHPNLSGRIGPSGDGLPVYAQGNVDWNNLKMMGAPADLLGVWVRTPSGCMIFYQPSGGA